MFVFDDVNVSVPVSIFGYGGVCIMWIVQSGSYTCLSELYELVCCNVY